jgi:hypothetical protein
MHRRGAICHIVQRFSRGNPCRATPLARWHCTTTPFRLAQRGATLEKLYLFHTISDEDDLYMKIIALDEIYNFLVFSFFI